MLLVAGGARDPHPARVLAAAGGRGGGVVPILAGPDEFPRVQFGPGDRGLWVDGERVRPTAAFLWHDVFHALVDPRAAVQRRHAAWYEAMLGYLVGAREVRWLNRGAALRRVNKIDQLLRAAAAGLAIPRTVISSDVQRLRDESGLAVAKPVHGGGYCVPLADALGEVGGAAAPQPAFVQVRLDGPEVRAYVVGERVLAWEILTAALDHRTDATAPVRPVSLPEAVQASLRRLARDLGLDFAAADLKRDPATGELVFLEINSQPMWTAYDTASGGAIAEALVDWLLVSG